MEGRIQTGSYTNKDGQRVYTTDVVAENVEFAESKNASAGNNDGGYQNAGLVVVIMPPLLPEPVMVL